MIKFLLAIPAFIKVGGVFTGMLVSYRLRMPLGVAIFLWAVVLTAWSGAGTAGFAYQLQSFSLAQNYLLPVVILLLLMFSEALNASGRMKQTIEALNSRISDKRMMLGGLPALVGLVPMPGGALFSAPMVGSVDEGKSLDPAFKAAVNYWFRHLWEYWWPLYPGVILAIRYSSVPAGYYYLFQLPFTVIAGIGGWFFLLRKLKMKSGGTRPDSAPFTGRTSVLPALVPIAILLAVSMAGSTALTRAGISGNLSSMLSMLAGLLLALVMVCRSDRIIIKKTLGTIRKKNTLLMIILVIGIQVFSASLKCPLSGDITDTLVHQMQNDFLHRGVPLLLVFALVPFVSGMVTGVAFGFVGASFPIVLGLLGGAPPFHVLMAATSFAFGCGYIGMLLSPVHVCFVVTNEYFRANMFSTYRHIIPPALVQIAFCCVVSGAYYLLLR